MSNNNISQRNFNQTFYSEALRTAFNPDPVDGLYTYNASTPLGVHAGIRQLYEFGLYSHCGYTNATAGICSNHTIPGRFVPYDVITVDMANNYSQITNTVLLNTIFHNSGYLGTESKAAYYLILLGTICAFLALGTYVASTYSLRLTELSLIRGLFAVV